MTAMDPDRLVEALVAAPAGVALLASLEAEHRPDQSGFASPPDSHPTAVGAAAQAVATMPFGDIAARAVGSAARLAGPWTPDAPDLLACAYQEATARRPIAEAIVAHFGPELSAPVDHTMQEWWTSDPGEFDFAARGPRFTDLELVYGNGQFSWQGLWTVTNPPPAVHQELGWAWELSPAMSRWRLPVQPSARVWEIRHPDDWAQLVETYPSRAHRPHGGWELPGRNQHRREVIELLNTPGQNAVRGEIGHQVLPDWGTVAAAWDGVHLSWAGFLTSEGYISELADDGVTMLRYWFSERTTWLADVFGEPEPLHAPTLDEGVDATVDLERQGQDRDTLRRLFGR
ncbi:MAG: hypothetical protein GY929_18440 [Actinomycetia bacterium]|nr:hypothetical protein [Actinomycetes bacterium]